MSTLALVFVTAAVGAQAAPRPPAGWVARALPAAGSGELSGEWDCANKAHDEWTVAAEQEHLAIAPRSTAAPRPLPFTPQLGPGEPPNTFRGVTALAPVSDGYLAGFSRGEFGGGLFWFNADGSKHTRITVPSASWFPENVVGLFSDGRAFYVFQGLAHLASRKGRVLKVQEDTRHGWAASVLVDLGTAPAVVLEEIPGTWLVATSNGLTRVTSRGTAERVWEQPSLGFLYPSSITRTTDSAIYVGMRAWVLRVLTSKGGAPVVDLLAPAACPAFAPTQPCRCQQQKDAGP